jgi:MFS family permease
VLTAGASAAIFLLVPEKPAAKSDGGSLAEQARECGRYLADARFWRIAPVSMLGMASGMAIQGLWSGPYLRDVGGLSRTEAAEIQFVLAAALTLGFTLTGIVADRLQRLGISLKTTLCAGVGLYAANLLVLAAGWAPTSWLTWIAFGLLSNGTVLAYPILSAQFPIQASGRVNTMLNGVVFGFAFFAQAGLGWIIGLWPPNAAGNYPEIAYTAAFSLPMLVMLAALAWYLYPIQTPKASGETGNPQPSR